MILMFYFYLYRLFSTLNVTLMNFEEDPRASLCPSNAPPAGQRCIRTYNNRVGANTPAAFSAMFDRVQEKASAGQYRPLVKERQRNIVFSRRYGPGAFLRASLDKRNSPASQPERFIRLRQGLFVLFFSSG